MKSGTLFQEVVHAYNSPQFAGRFPELKLQALLQWLDEAILEGIKESHFRCIGVVKVVHNERSKRIERHLSDVGIECTYVANISEICLVSRSIVAILKSHT